MSIEYDFNALIKSLGPLLVRSPLFQHQGPTAGFYLIHADWPAYSTGDGIGCAISTLAEFPDNTKFFPIDFIDQYTLFAAEKKASKNEYDKSLYHICIGDNDIRCLIEEGYVHGPNLVPNDPDEYGSAGPTIDYSPGGYLRLAEKGHRLAQVLELTYDIENDILEQVRNDLVYSRFTDAVRRASVLLEGKLRQASNTEKYGQKLIEECFGEEGCLLPQAKCSLTISLEIRAMYRRFFKYVRNEVAHGEPYFDLNEACQLLRRCSLLWKITTTLAEAKNARESGDK